MTRIKFCGMTRAEDVATAIELEVDALGFVLWPGSPRYVDAARLAALLAAVPPHVSPVGVFVRPTRDDLDRAIDAGIRVAQLHAMPETPVDTVGCELWMATSLSDSGIEPTVSDAYTVLLDAHDPEKHGGTGLTIDWTRAAAIAARRRVVLAGGLTAMNVGQAIREVRPYAVDVASGIEDRPGLKNAQAMRAFVAAVRQADHSSRVPGFGFRGSEVLK